MRYLLVLILLMPSAALAQVNAEAFRGGDNKGGFSSQFDLSFGYLTGNVNQTYWDSELRFDYLSEDTSKLNGTSHHVFLVGSWGRGEAQGKPYKDNLFSHLRWVHLWDTNAGTEYFLQTQYDEFKDLRQRSLVGLGWRHEFWLISTLLAYGVGTMLEYEDIMSTSQTQLVVRSTNYVSASIKKTLNFVGYYQPLWINPSDFRVSIESQVDIPATQTLSFVFVLKYLYDSVPPQGVQKQDVNSALKLRVSW